jgi:non-canonical poly(A) RNA polymerase PAPD5/7
MSRLPPLPPGLPPRPVTGDSYRPGATRNDRFESRDYRDYDRVYDRDRDNDRRAPPMYQFGSDYDSYQPSRDDRVYDRYHGDRRYAPGAAPPSLRPSSSVYRPQFDQGPPPPPGDFTFRYDAPPPIAAARDEMYRPRSPPPRRYNDNQNNSGYKQDHGRGQQVRGGYRGRGGPRQASNRAFLRTNRDPTPELMPGMDEEENGVKFKSINDVSDSEEAEMDMSDDEAGADEQPAKKARTVGKAADGDSVPRWSNPDPYTALPPPDESQRKKKDVVKLIRKARVEASSATAAKVEPADDFISFDLADDGDDLQMLQPPKSGMGVAGAPTGPRFSHNTNLHGQQTPSAPAAAVSSPISNQRAQAQGNIQNLQARTDIQNVPGRVNTENIPRSVTDQKSQAQVVANGQRSNNGNIRFDLTVPEADPALAKVSRASKPVNLDTTSDPALGSRKRTIRDEIKAAPVLHKVGKGPIRGKVNGQVLQEWKPKANAPSTPWLEIDHSDTVNMGLWYVPSCLLFIFERC